MVTIVRAFARRGLAAAAALGALASASAVLLLGAAAWLISTASTLPPVLALGVGAVLVRGAAVGRAVFRYAERLVGHDAALRSLAGLRVRVWHQLARVAPAGLAAFSRGDLLNRLVADIDDAIDLPLRVVLPWLQGALVAVATLVFFAFLAPGIGLVVGVGSIALLVAVPALVARGVRGADSRLAPARALLGAVVVRALDGAREVAALGLLRPATDAVAGADDRLATIGRREARLLGLGSALVLAVQGLVVGAAVVLGAAAVQGDRLDAVWLGVVVLVALALVDVLAGLPSAAVAYARTRGSVERIVELDHVPSPVPPVADPVELPQSVSSLHIRDLSVSWPGDSRPAVAGVSFAVRTGERVAIVGPSGAGKSTLIAALMGFLPYAGSARIDEVEVRVVLPESLRDSVGLFQQRAHLFSTSIRENVALGDVEADDQQIWLALRQAQADEWVRTLPRGLDTQVGPFGAAVSGGQGQRIALARLILARRRIVLVDEPTEHLDAVTADRLMSTLETTFVDAATVLATHRMAEARRADRIVEIVGGRMTATGTHDEVLARGGWYADQMARLAGSADMARLLERLPAGTAVPAGSAWT